MENYSVYFSVDFVCSRELFPPRAVIFLKDERTKKKYVVSIDEVSDKVPPESIDFDMAMALMSAHPKVNE